MSIGTESGNSMAESQDWMWSSVAGAEIVRGGAEAHETRLKRWPYNRGEAGNGPGKWPWTFPQRKWS